MALTVAEVLVYTNRYTSKYLIELTNRESYNEDTSVLDEDVLERGIKSAQFFVKQRIGTQIVTHEAVVEFTQYFLEAPRGMSGEQLSNLQTQLSMIVPSAIASSTNAKPVDDTDDDRRYTGDDYENDLDSQASFRPRRSSR